MHKHDTAVLIGGLALVPVIAFAVLWVALLATIGIAGLLHWMGVG